MGLRQVLRLSTADTPSDVSVLHDTKIRAKWSRDRIQTGGYDGNMDGQEVNIEQGSYL